MNVLAFGLPGTGKSHALCALGHRLVEAGYSVLFTPAYRLVQELLAARRELQLPRALRKLDNFDFLVVDDLGYLPLGATESEVLFTLMAERYERRAMGITSNLVFSQWDQVFQNPMATAAAIDRVVHHAVILEFDVPSFRTGQAQEHLREEADDNYRRGCRGKNNCRQAANLVLLGPPGVGKTHLAVALALEAISRGYGAYFVRAYQLMEDLRKAQEEHRLDRRLRVYLAPKVLIIDEFGIWPYDRAAATAFFTLVSARYERGSIILTSNKGFGEWGELLGDSVIAAAILDRLLHHSHVFNIRGESYRLAEKRTAGLLGGVTPLPHQAITTLSSPGNQSEDQGVGQN